MYLNSFGICPRNYIFSNLVEEKNFDSGAEFSAKSPPSSNATPQNKIRHQCWFIRRTLRIFKNFDFRTIFSFSKYRVGQFSKILAVEVRIQNAIQNTSYVSPV